MAFKELAGRLKAYEERVKPAEQVEDRYGKLLLTRDEWDKKQKTEMNGADNSRGAGSSEYRGRGRGRGRYNSQGRGKNDPDQEDQTERRDRRNLRCYISDKIGHFSAECQAPRRIVLEVNLVIE
jgi:hypothetical protein